MLGTKAQIQFSAGSLSLNDVPATNVLIEGSIDNDRVTLTNLGADIARGTLTGNAQRNAVLYLVLPESMYSLIGILGGIGVGLSATYGWQAVFNSWGAMSIAMTFLGVGGAIFYRIFNNAFGAFYALVFYQLFSIGMDWIAEVKKKRVSV